MIYFEQLTTDIPSVMPLLLIGDESEEMIARYLPGGTVYVAKLDGKIVAVCVVVELDNDWVEIKNLAVLPNHRRQGIGRSMLEFAESQHPRKKFRLGTGETPSTLRFYDSCGYRYSHRIKRFFTDNYDHPIVEEGVTLRDMLYLVKAPQPII